MEKINIAELLCDCPSGMELDCTMYDNIVFDHIDKKSMYPIKCRAKITDVGSNSYEFTKNGQPNHYSNAKCVIFPKGKTTWEGFHRPFKDGDVVISTSNNIHLISCSDKNYGGWESCCGIIYDKFDSTKTVHVIPTRLATEEEKQRLFDAIREKGYHWNTESKTLENWTIQDAKDGDVVSYSDGWTCIFKCIHGIWYSSYCFITSDGEFHTGYEDHEVSSTINGKVHLATKEQCNLLFQKIKEAGYKWNLETKTLEKLTESKEDTEEKTVMAGIYFDREYYADEVELHLNNYEIENRDGKTYAVIKNQETKISKPKFKDGDVIVDKYGAVAIYKRVHSSYEEPYVDFYCGISSTFRSLYIKDSDSLQHCGRIDTLRLATEEEKQELFQAIKEKGYRWDAETKVLVKLIEPYFKIGDKIRLKNDKTRIRYIDYIYYDSYALRDGHIIYFKEQDQYELVSDKFDITTLKPFESRVLVRDANCYEWEADIFGRYSDGYIDLGGGKWKQCIPYEGNEHLLGKTDDCDEFFKIWKNEKDDNSIQCD